MSGIPAVVRRIDLSPIQKNKALCLLRSTERSYGGQASERNPQTPGRRRLCPCPRNLLPSISPIDRLSSVYGKNTKSVTLPAAGSIYVQNAK
jgi:hypothetical protein